MSKTLRIVTTIITIAAITALTIFAVHTASDQYNEIESLKK